MIDILISSLLLSTSPAHGNTMPYNSIPPPPVSSVASYPIDTNISFSAKSIYGIDADNGSIVFAKNENEILPVASLTKLATALTALENIPSIETPIFISRTAARIPGSKLYLVANTYEPFSVVLSGLLIRSGNDAALAISEYFTDTPSFMELLHNTLAQHNITHSSFKNPHGLDEANHSSTAYDITHIVRLLLQYPIASQALSSKYITYNANVYENTNQLIGNSGVYGGKTGTTEEARECLSIIYEIHKKKYIFTFLGSENRYSDATKMLSLLQKNIPEN